MRSPEWLARMIVKSQQTQHEDQPSPRMSPMFFGAWNLDREAYYRT
jgi:hypothetical protein